MHWSSRRQGKHRTNKNGVGRFYPPQGKEEFPNWIDKRRRPSSIKDRRER